jgi:hypothetical protein
MTLLFDKSGRAIVARIGLFVAVIFTVGVISSCNDKQVRAVAANVDRAALAIKDAREVVGELVEYKAIDQDAAFKATLGLQRINTALKAFNNRARTYANTDALTPSDKALLKKLAGDIAGAATELINDGTLGIKDPVRQAKYTAVIDAIKQATLAIVDTIEQLQTKSTPAQQSGIELIGLLPLLLQTLRQIVEFKNRETARKGETTEEVFANADAQLDENAAGLLNDLAKYTTGGEPLPAVSQANLDAFAEHLAQFKPVQ